MKAADKPTLQEFHLKGVRHILPEDAWKEYKNNTILLIDVREEYETKEEAIEDVLFYPTSQIEIWLPELQKDQNMIVFCHKGIRSTHIVHFLNSRNFQNVVNMDGGFSAWKDQGLPFKKPYNP